jgi:hypothetical protein
MMAETNAGKDSKMDDVAKNEIEGSETGETGKDTGFEDSLFGDDELGEDGPEAGGDGEGESGDESGDDDKGAGTDAEKSGTEDDSGAEGKDGDGKDAEGDGKSYDFISLGRPVSVKETDVVPLLQKGLDYDHVKGDRDRMRGVIEFYAGQSGVSADEYLNYVTANMDAIAHENAKRAVEAERPDLDEAAISEMARARTARQRDETARANAAREGQFLTFVRRFPGVKSEDIPADVIAAVRNGANLTEEYSAYRVRAAEQRIAEFEAKAKAETKNEENKSRALGNMGTAGGATEPDAFLAGFES